MILSSVHLSVCIVAELYILWQVSEVNRKCPSWTVFTAFNPYTDSIPSNSLPPKFYLVFLIMWPYCLCCYKCGRVLLLNWWLVHRMHCSMIDFLSNSWASSVACAILLSRISTVFVHFMFIFEKLLLAGCEDGIKCRCPDLLSCAIDSDRVVLIL